MSDALPVERALTALGELLATEGEEVYLVAVGGAALRLLGLIDRTTSDVDVIARLPDASGSVSSPDPLPPAVVRAAAAVARDLDLPADWLNTEIAAPRGPVSHPVSGTTSPGAGSEARRAASISGSSAGGRSSPSSSSLPLTGGPAASTSRTSVRSAQPASNSRPRARCARRMPTPPSLTSWIKW